MAVDFNKLIYNTLPYFLRKVRTLAYLYSFGEVMAAINRDFDSYKQGVEYTLQWNGQTIYLERFLNEQHDPIGGGIFITNSDDLPYTYWFNKAENKPPRYLYNVVEGGPNTYLFNQVEVDQAIHFTVNIPVAVSYSPIEVNANIERYAIAGKNWEIVTY